MTPGRGSDCISWSLTTQILKSFSQHQQHLLVSTSSPPCNTATRLCSYDYSCTAVHSACRIYKVDFDCMVPLFLIWWNSKVLIILYCLIVIIFFVNEADLIVKLNQSVFHWGRLKSSSVFPEEPQLGSHGLRQCIINSIIPALLWSVVSPLQFKLMTAF